MGTLKALEVEGTPDNCRRWEGGVRRGTADTSLIESSLPGQMTNHPSFIILLVGDEAALRPVFDCKGGVKDLLHNSGEGLCCFANGTRGKSAYCLTWKMTRFIE